MTCHSNSVAIETKKKLLTLAEAWLKSRLMLGSYQVHRDQEFCPADIRHPFEKQISGADMLHAAIDLLEWRRRRQGLLTCRQARHSPVLSQMVQYVEGGFRFPTSVKKSSQVLSGIVPRLHDNQNRIMVTLRESHIRSLGTSLYNKAQIYWVTEQNIEVLHDDSLTFLDGTPASILVIPYYSAHLQMYELKI